MVILCYKTHLHCNSFIKLGSSTKLKVGCNTMVVSSKGSYTLSADIIAAILTRLVSFFVEKGSCENLVNRQVAINYW